MAHRIGWRAGIALGFSLAFAATAAAQQYPSKPIHYIVPFAAGGPTDVISRMVMLKVQDAIGQPVLVENIAGQGGSLGAGRLAKSPADGYTIGLTHVGTQAINPHLYARLDYDPLRDFSPVARLSEYVNILVVNAGEPYKNVADLVRAAKASPGAIAYGSAGNGSSNHLSGELLASLTGAKFTHVPYKGSAPAITDLVAGRIAFMFDVLLTSQPHISAGKLRVIAATSRTRMRQLPDVPTVAEAVPGYEVVGWIAVMGPAGMPRPIVERLNGEIGKVLRQADIMDKLVGFGHEAAFSTPEQLGEVVKKDFALWGPVVKASGAKAE